jgi:hypothetical protein
VANERGKTARGKKESAAGNGTGVRVARAPFSQNPTKEGGE